VAKKLLSLILVLGMALGAAACGDDDDDAGDDAASTTVAPNDDNGDDGGGGALSGSECAELANIPTQLATALSPTGSGDEVEAGVEYFERIATTGPEEIRADLRVVADVYSLIARVFSEVDVDFSTGSIPPEKATELAAKFSELQGQIDQPRLETASENIRTWAEENCDTAG
jgi:hypothetical protein